MIIYPTFDRSIRLHIRRKIHIDEKFSPDQFVFILPFEIMLKKPRVK